MQGGSERDVARVVEDALALMDRERMTQSALAEALGVSQGHLSRILRGEVRRRSRTIRALAEWVEGRGGVRRPVAGALAVALAEAARASPEFKDALEKAVEIMRNIRS